MRHRLKNQLYGYKQGPRKALIRSLFYSLVENGRIQTTLARAKEVRRHIEKAITQAKRNTLHSRRILLSRFPNKKVISLFVDKIAPNFKNRRGGYTRIIKTASRLGDASKRAFLEFVHYDGQGAYKAKYFIPKEKNPKPGKQKKAQKGAVAKGQKKGAKDSKDTKPLLEKSKVSSKESQNKPQKEVLQNQSLRESEDEKKD